MIKASLALGALIASLINAAPINATASRISAERSIGYGVPPKLAYLVEAAGVSVFDGRDYPEFCAQHDGKVLGVYNSKINAMLMCVQNFGDRKDLYVEVFAHEAVHMAQDCRAGIANIELFAGTPEYLKGLWRYLPEFKQDNILKNYPKEAYDTEIEAFYFEDYPDEVANAVSDVCF